MTTPPPFVVPGGLEAITEAVLSAWKRPHDDEEEALLRQKKEEGGARLAQGGVAEVHALLDAEGPVAAVARLRALLAMPRAEETPPPRTKDILEMMLRSAEGNPDVVTHAFVEAFA